MGERRLSKNGYQGRGGAGNYVDNKVEIASQQIKRADVNAKIHQEAVEMVDMTLKEPEQAHVRGQSKQT